LNREGLQQMFFGSGKKPSRLKGRGVVCTYRKTRSRLRFHRSRSPGFKGSRRGEKLA